MKAEIYVAVQNTAQVELQVLLQQMLKQGFLQIFCIS
jgi:hypothetical protein